MRPRSSRARARGRRGTRRRRPDRDLAGTRRRPSPPGLLAPEEARDLEVVRVVCGGSLDRDRLADAALDSWRHDGGRGPLLAAGIIAVGGVEPLPLQLLDDVAPARRA